MRVNTIWRGEENHRKKKQFCNFPLLKGAFQLVGRLLFSVHDLEMITLTSFFSGHHYHYHYYHLLTTIMFKIPETTCFQQAGWNGHGKLAVFFHIPNDRRICRIYGHHQKNVLILLQCIAMWEERKIHVVPISLWLSVLYTKFHPSKKKTYFCPRRWQWPLVRHQLAFAFTSESSPFLSSCWLSFIQIYVSKMKDDTLMLCKCW